METAVSDTSASASPRPLAGPAFGPKEGGAARWLCVLLHGVGADGNDLIALAPLLADVLPDARFLAPHGPEPFDMAPMGRQWFSLLDRSEGALEAGVRRAGRDVDRFVEDALGDLGLGADRSILIGFSQGAMTALFTGLRREAAPAAILAFSGALIASAALAAEIRCRPPVCVIHGDADDVVPVDSAPAAEKALREAGVPVESHILEGLGHGIDEAALGLATAFLRRVTGA